MQKCGSWQITILQGFFANILDIGPIKNPHKVVFLDAGKLYFGASHTRNQPFLKVIVVIFGR